MANPKKGGDKGDSKGDAKASPAAKSTPVDIVHSIYNKATKVLSGASHEKASAKVSDKGSKHAAAAPKENIVNRYINKAAHAGEKYVAKAEKYIAKAEKYIAKKVDRLDHGQKVAHADKLTPNERAQKNVREYVDPKTQKAYHYDKQGRIDEVKGKNKSVIEVEYKPGEKHDKVSTVNVINAQGDMLAHGKSSKTHSIKVDQTSGEVATHDRTVRTVENIHGEKKNEPIEVERQINSEGMINTITKDGKGRRIEKIATGPDARLLHQTKYEYPQHKNKADTNEAVIANQFDANGDLKHQLIFSKAADVEKQDATIRIDRNRQERDGVISDKTETFNLHHDRKNPVASSEQTTDYKHGTVTIKEQALDQGKVLSSKQLTLDEMGQTQSFKYKNESQKIDVTLNYHEGKVATIDGKNGGLDKATLIQASDSLILPIRANYKVEAMDHGQLLAHRGPSQPRDGEKPSGTVVYLDGDKFVQHNVDKGIVYDQAHKKIGTVKDNGDVQIGNTTFNITNDEKRAGAFMGRGSDGRYLDLTNGQSSDQGKRQEGFNGYISNNKEKMLTLGGHIFAEDAKLFGQMDATGNVNFAKNIDQQEKNQTKISALLRDNYSFTGNENGHQRNFDLNRTSSGQFFMPTLDAKTGQQLLDKDGKPALPQDLELRLGMLIDKKSQEQVGKFVPPNQNKDGSFSDGSVEINGKVIPLSSLKNAVFKATIDGQEKEMRGAVLGPSEIQADGSLRPNTGGIINLDLAIEKSKNNLDEKQKILNQATEQQKKQAVLDQASALPFVGSAIAYTNAVDKQDNYSYDAKQTALGLADKQFQSDKAAIDKMLLNGQLDDNSIYKIQKMGLHNKRDNAATPDQLRALIDGQGHILEKVPPNLSGFGELKIPGLEKPGEISQFDVNKSLVYKKGTDELVGSVNLTTGTLRIFDEHGNQLTNKLSDSNLRGASLNVTCVDENGNPANKLHWINDGRGQLQSLDQLRKQVAQERAYAEMMAKGVTSGEPVERLERVKALEKRYNNTLEEIQRNGIKDSTKAENGFTTLEILRGGPKEFVRSEHDRPGRHQVGKTIEVPRQSSDEECAKTSGQLRIGHGHFYADKGQLYRTTFDKEKNEWVPLKEPCGKLEPGYKARIDGQVVELQNDPNFLFKMKIAGDDKEHWIMGLGEPRRDATGKLIDGGLIDAKEIMRQSSQSKEEIAAANKDYIDSQSWGVLGWAVDAGMLSGREAQISQINDTTIDGQRLFLKQMNNLFEDGLNSNTLATADIQHNVRSMQTRLAEMNVSANDAARLAQEGKNTQANVREGVALAATTVLTGGVSTMVAAGTMTVRGGIMVSAAGGAFSSAAIRQTRGGDWKELASNAGSGGLEALLMGSGGHLTEVAKSFTTLGRSGELLAVVSKEQNLVKFQALAKEEKLFKNLETLSELQKTGKLEQIGSTALKELAENPDALKMVNMISSGKGNEVKALCDILSKDSTAKALTTALKHGPLAVQGTGYMGSAVNAVYQTTGFNLINAGKTANFDEVTLGKILEGSAMMVTADGLTALTHYGPRYSLDKLGSKGKYLDTLISTYPDAVANNSINSALNARVRVRDVERENIAQDLKIDKSMVTDELFERFKNNHRMNAFVFDAALDGAASVAFTHPVTHIGTHYLGERVEVRDQAKLQDAIANEHSAYIGNIEAKINTSSLDGPQIISKSIVRNNEGLETVLIRNSGGELAQVGLPNGLVLSKGEHGWTQNKNDSAVSDVKAVSADTQGNLTIKHGENSTTTISVDGTSVERRPLGAEREVSQRSTQHGTKTEVVTENGKVTSIRIEKPAQGGEVVSSETKARYDQDGKLISIEPFVNCELRKEGNGWSLYLQDKLIKRDDYSDISILPDGTVQKESKSHIDGELFKTVEKPDGSSLTSKNNQLTKIVDAAGNETIIKRDQNGEPVELKLSAGADLVKTKDGWDIVVNGEHTAFCKDVTIDADGTVHRTNEIGAIATDHLDGTTTRYLPGDSVGPIDYHKELATFEQHLSAIKDPMAAAYIRDGMLDTHDRLRKDPATAERKIAEIIYDANRLLDAPGLVPLEQRQHWLDQFFSLAAKPEFVNQGSDPTCSLAACEQREYARHPETWLKTLRVLNETGAAVNHKGEVVKNFLDSDGKFNIDLVKTKSTPNSYQRVDGQKLEVSEIVQSVLREVIFRQNGGSKLMYSHQLEPMMKFMTGRDEKFVIAAPKDSQDLVRQLVAMKERGDLYAILELDASHLGAGGLNPNRGHARIIKDLSSPMTAQDMQAGSGSLRERYREDGLAIRPTGTTDASGRPQFELDPSRIEISLGNTWSKNDSHEVSSANKVFDTTLPAGKEAHLSRLEERIKANPTDPHERLELLSWKLGTLNSVLMHQLDGKVDAQGEAALMRLGNGSKVESVALLRELNACEADLRQRYSVKEELLHGKKAAAKLEEHISDLVDGYRSSSEGGINLSPSERQYLASLGQLKRALSEVHDMETAIALRPPMANADSSGTASTAIVDNEVRRAIGAHQDASNNLKAEVNSKRLVEAEENALPISEKKFARLLENKHINKFWGAHVASKFDMLTGYSNFNGMMHYLEKACAAKDGGGYLVSIDVRRFKLANDCMGREGADDALRFLTRHIAKEIGLKDSELLARAGGDEIMIFLDKSRTREEVKEVVEKLDTIHLACRGYSAPDANGKTYGMSLVGPKYPDKTNGDVSELLIKLAVGAVALHPGDSAHHVADRADAVMNQRKIAQEKVEKEKIQGKTGDDIKVPDAWIPDHIVPPNAKHGDMAEVEARLMTPSQLHQMEAPQRQVLEHIKQFEQLSEPQQAQERLRLQTEVDQLVLAGNHEQVKDLRKKQTDIEHFVATDPEKRTIYKKHLELECTKFEKLDIEGRRAYLQRREASSSLWVNPQTDHAGREIYERSLRRYVFKAERDNIEASKKGANTERFSVIQADLNNMKGINDQRGHDQGNVLLRHAGDYLRARIPQDCFIGSPGGGGFVIIAPNQERRAQVEKILQEYGQSLSSEAKESTTDKRQSLFVPDIALNEIRNDDGELVPTLRFGFSIGSAEYVPGKLKEPLGSNTEARASREEAISTLRKAASDNCDLDKKRLEQAGIRLKRVEKAEKELKEYQARLAADPTIAQKPPEELVFVKVDPSANPKQDFTEWHRLLEQKTLTYVQEKELKANPIKDAPPLTDQQKKENDAVWSRPVDTSMGPLDFFRSALQEQSDAVRKERQILKDAGVDADTVSNEHRRDILKMKAISFDDLDRRKFLPENIPNVYRELIRVVSAEKESWTVISPTDPRAQEIADARALKVHELLQKCFHDMGMNPPTITAGSPTLKANEKGEYAKGSGVVSLQRDAFLDPKHFEIDVLGHEAFGHYVQENMILRSQALDKLRENGSLDLSKLIKETAPNRVELTPEGVNFCSNLRLNDSSTLVSSRATKEMVEQVFLAAAPWLKERTAMPKEQLRSDSDYVAGHRLADSMFKELHRTESPSEAIYKLLTGKPANDILTDLDHTRLLEIVSGNAGQPHANFDYKTVMKKLFDTTSGDYQTQLANSEYRKSLFGYDPFRLKITDRLDGDGKQTQKWDKDKPISLKDDLFKSLLNEPSFFERHPEFLTKLIESSSAPDRETRAAAQKKWLEIIAAENPLAVPNEQLAIGRFKMLGYKFANEQLADSHEGAPTKLGDLTKEIFEKDMPAAVHTMLCANVRFAYIREANKYQNSLHEQRARLVQDVFSHLLATNDLIDRSHGATMTARDFNNGKVLIPNIGKTNLVVSRQLAPLYEGKEGLVIRPDPAPPKVNKPSDTVAETAGKTVRRLSLDTTTFDTTPLKMKDYNQAINEIKIQQSMAKMMLIQRMQEAANETPLNIKEDGGIPEGYMPQYTSDETLDRTTNGHDDTNGGDNSKQLQDRSTGQSTRQQPGETARLASKDDLASMPDKNENNESTLPQVQTPMQPTYDAAQQMEAFRLQAERNRIMRKRPLGE
jgi:diguanylate cyclase (GGDEF)-like protein